jgi:hypothetical protein
MEERVARIEAYLGFTAEAPAFPKADEPAAVAPAPVAPVVDPAPTV